MPLIFRGGLIRPDNLLICLIADSGKSFPFNPNTSFSTDPFRDQGTGPVQGVIKDCTGRVLPA